MIKPRTLSGYGEFNLDSVRATCLYVATKFGDFIDDFVIVGGLAPSLLVDQSTPNVMLDPHAGTMDLDVGLSLAILDRERYRDFRERLADAGFEPDENDRGNQTNQRWRTSFAPRTTVDFLIPSGVGHEVGGELIHIERGFAAVVNECLHLAFEDRQKVSLSGTTPFGEEATREVWVCGPGSFTVLKTLAFQNRGMNKDAYDLTYVWRHLGVDVVADFLKSRQGDGCVQSAISTIQRDFGSFDSVGSRRAAEFTLDVPDDEMQADVVGLATRLLNLLGIEPD